mgnify:CR=1 FL=1
MGRQFVIELYVDVPSKLPEDAGEELTEKQLGNMLDRICEEVEHMIADRTGNWVGVTADLIERGE